MIWRPMQPADLLEVETLGNAIHADHPERPEVFAERLRLAPATCFVLANATIHGYLIAHPWSGPPPALDTLLGVLPDPDHLYLHDLTLAPTARGHGHAAAILRRLAGPMALTAVGRSAPFWQSHGFTQAPISPEKLVSYGPTAVYMRRAE